MFLKKLKLNLSLKVSRNKPKEINEKKPKRNFELKPISHYTPIGIAFYLADYLLSSHFLPFFLLISLCGNFSSSYSLIHNSFSVLFSYAAKKSKWKTR